MSEVKKGHKKLAIGIVVLIVVIAVLFIPMILVDVAYSETEPYSRECQYEVVSAILRESWDIIRGTYHISEVTVKNIDSYGGTFKVTHYLAIGVIEKYLDVKIQNFRGGNVEVQPDGAFVLTMDLVNTLNLDGHIQLIIQAKEPVPFSVSGTGTIYFGPRETKKDYKVTVYNAHASVIREKTVVNFVLAVWNGERYTSTVNFTATFLPGAGLPNTGISIRCVNKNNPTQGIESVSITVFWGSAKEKRKPGITTTGGYCPITLDIPFEGKIDIHAKDNYGRFHPANLTDVYVSPTKENSFTIEMQPIEMQPIEKDVVDWEKWIPYIIVGGVGVSGLIIGAYALKRRREVYY